MRELEVGRASGFRGIAPWVSMDRMGSATAPPSSGPPRRLLVSPRMLSETRKLAAIMFTDIAAYTALMGEDEQRARQALERSRELLARLVPQFNGKLIEYVGDGSLSSFDSAVGAVSCAHEIQEALRDDA
jgi:class 3 adenylate cyclase